MARTTSSRKASRDRLSNALSGLPRFIRYESWITVSLISCAPMFALYCSASSRSSGLDAHCIWFFENICMQSHVTARARSGAFLTPPVTDTWPPRSFICRPGM